MGNTTSRDSNSTNHHPPVIRTQKDEQESPNYKTVPSELTLPEQQGSASTVFDRVIIVSGGPFSDSSDNEEEKKIDDSSSSPSTAGDTVSTSFIVSEQGKVDYKVKPWCGTKFYSDLVQEGLEWLQKSKDRVVLVYESPSYDSEGTSFQNRTKYVFHDDSPAGSPVARTTLGPLRYAATTGSAIPVYIKDAPPLGLLEHWAKSIPNFVAPTFVHQVHDNDHVFAYLPLESVQNHVNDPQIHYHLAGKDAIPLMTNKTTKLLPNTRDVRPCIAKVNTSMGSRGIFVIRNDDDEQEFVDFLNISGNPPYVVTEFIEITRNIACHFFIHPTGEITWLGSSENVRLEDGRWSADSTMDLTKADELQALQIAQVRDVADYALSLGFWGFCGIDVLIDTTGRGYVVDVNPRVTGTCPAILTHKGMKDMFGFDYGLFRRSNSHAYPGSAAQLLAEVESLNLNHQGRSRVVVFSLKESSPERSLLNIGVYGTSLDECELLLNHFSRLFKHDRVTYM